MPPKKDEKIPVKKGRKKPDEKEVAGNRSGV